MSSTPEMSQEESSYQAVRKPSRYIRKTLLDVLFTASAESKKHHQLPDEWVTKPPADFIPNIQATLADVHLQFKEKKKKSCSTEICPICRFMSKVLLFWTTKFWVSMICGNR